MQFTRSGAFLGTPRFASPEQLRGAELDRRSALYAVGVTLSYLLTGKLPFAAGFADAHMEAFALLLPL